MIKFQWSHLYYFAKKKKKNYRTCLSNAKRKINNFESVKKANCRHYERHVNRHQERCINIGQSCQSINPRSILILKLNKLWIIHERAGSGLRKLFNFFILDGTALYRHHRNSDKKHTRGTSRIQRVNDASCFCWKFRKNRLQRIVNKTALSATNGNFATDPICDARFAVPLRGTAFVFYY